MIVDGWASAGVETEGQISQARERFDVCRGISEEVEA